MAAWPASNGCRPFTNSRVKEKGRSQGIPMRSSACCLDAAPMPSVKRPPRAVWAVMACCATSMGCRPYSGTTEVPNSVGAVHRRPRRRAPQWGGRPSHGRPRNYRTPTRRPTVPLRALPPVARVVPRRGPIVHPICHWPTSAPSSPCVLLHILPLICYNRSRSAERTPLIILPYAAQSRAMQMAAGSLRMARCSLWRTPKGRGCGPSTWRRRGAAGAEPFRPHEWPCDRGAPGQRTLTVWL